MAMFDILDSELNSNNFGTMLNGIHTDHQIPRSLIRDGLSLLRDDPIPIINGERRQYEDIIPLD